MDAKYVLNKIAELNKKGYSFNFTSTKDLEDEMFRIEVSGISPNSGKLFGKGIIISKDYTDKDIAQYFSHIETSMLRGFENELLYGSGDTNDKREDS